MRSLNWQAAQDNHSHLNQIQVDLKQLLKFAEDGKHVAQGVVTAAADVNSVIERYTGWDLDGDGTVSQQPLCDCRSWHYFFPCVDKRCGGVACRSEKARSWRNPAVNGSETLGFRSMVFQGSLGTRQAPRASASETSEETQETQALEHAELR